MLPSQAKPKLVAAQPMRKKTMSHNKEEEDREDNEEDGEEDAPEDDKETEDKDEARESPFAPEFSEASFATAGPSNSDFSSVMETCRR